MAYRKPAPSLACFYSAALAWNPTAVDRGNWSNSLLQTVLFGDVVVRVNLSLSVLNRRGFLIMPFAPHGKITISIEGRLFIVSIDGPLNIETVRSYVANSKLPITSMGENGPWAAIITVKKSALMTDDAYQFLKKGLSAPYRRENRVGLCWVITPDTEGYQFVDSLLHNLYEGSGPFQIFERQEDAIGWCTSLLGCPRRTTVVPTTL